MSTRANEEERQLQINLIKLGQNVRRELESQIKIVEKTILINGILTTVNVKICPATYGTGLAGQVIYGRAMFGDKLVNRTNVNRFLQSATTKVKSYEDSSSS